MFKTKVKETILDYCLFSQNSTILVALSGGADSVALLRVLHSLGYKCIALHCNFHLRGKESDRDETFVRKLCTDMDIRCLVRHFDTTQYAEEKGLSIEMAARELRYEWFDQCVEKHIGDVVAVAHHKDDNVETFLINLTRGSGINGLKGMRIRNGNIVRPLLNVSKKEILDYLKELNQDFVTDSTNLENEYTRNKMRLDIIPAFEKINPAFKETIIETIHKLAQTAEIYNQAIDQSRQRVMYGNEIDIAALNREISPVTVLFEILYPYGFNPAQVKDIYKTARGQSGKRFTSEKYEIIKDRTKLLIYPKKDNPEEIIKLNDDSTTEIPCGTLTKGTIAIESDFRIDPDKNTAYIDTDKIKGALHVRKWKHGDSFIPLGMKGKKNISDYLTDKKKNIIEKENTYILTDEENIVWIVGERLDDRYKITPKTKETTIIKYIKH